MKRRLILSTMASLYGAQVLLRHDAQAAEPKREGDLHDPYADVDWDKCDYLHSMSHQHTGQTAASCEEFYAMGYRHLAFSNYYPFAPTYLLPQAFLAKHSDVVAAPNAEQHSMPNAGLPFNSLGSLLATGYGSSLSAARLRWFTGLMACRSSTKTAHGARFSPQRWTEKQPPGSALADCCMRMGAASRSITPRRIVNSTRCFWISIPAFWALKYGISSRRVPDPAKDFTMTAQGRICTSTSCGTSC
ncbi:MAG: hypothetical protein J0L73_12375 [Verrucomicrobia bacterium]|nr:hypothetical protein [Verrucomicrobiota bacterium]